MPPPPGRATPSSGPAPPAGLPSRTGGPAPARPPLPGSQIEETVAEVIAAVRSRGDEALCEFARRWDGVEQTPAGLRVSEEAIRAADDSTEFARAFQRAADRIRRFHQAVRPRGSVVDDAEGVRMEVRWTPIRSVGLYIPGGRASYPSSLAMTAIPAQVAGVSRIAVVSPPGPGGEVSPEVLLAAKVLGLREVYRVGGAQAVAALALGTGAIPAVDKVFGPGNAYVAEAKRQLYGVVGIDLLAGPSEIVVYADGTAEPEWVAADLLAQAEHDAAARPMLIASSAEALAAVRAALERRAREEPRRETALLALERNGLFEVEPDLARAAARIDELAPEHLSIQSARPRGLLELVKNAGAVYLGGWSPVALGDYYAGPNHVLPTGGAARFASGLSVEDFLKRSTVVEAEERFLRARGRDVEVLAMGEGLPAHASSVRVRIARPGSAVERKAQAAPAAPGRSPRPRAGVRAARAYTLVEEEAEVKLNQNECPWDVPAELKERILERLGREAWHRYPQRLPAELRRRIAGEERIPEEGVWLANGSNLLLSWIFQAYGGPGTLVLLPRPSFSLYRLWAEVSETVVEEFPLGERFEYPTAEVLARVRASAPALTVLCLPNNPTGSELHPAEVGRIAAAAEERGGLVVVDEAYREFSGPAFDRTPLVRERPNVVLVRTCSKAFAAAGLRLGYVLAPAEVGRELGKVVPPFHLSLFAAVAGLGLWDERERFLEQVNRIVEERRKLQAALAALPGVEALPSEANFFLLRVKDARRVFAGLRERGILLRLPGDDPALEGCLRVTTGKPEENRRLVEALREVLGK